MLYGAYVYAVHTLHDQWNRDDRGHGNTICRGSSIKPFYSWHSHIHYKVTALSEKYRSYGKVYINTHRVHTPTYTSIYIYTYISCFFYFIYTYINSASIHRYVIKALLFSSYKSIHRKNKNYNFNKDWLCILSKGAGNRKPLVRVTRPRCDLLRKHPRYPVTQVCRIELKRKIVEKRKSVHLSIFFF